MFLIIDYLPIFHINSVFYGNFQKPITTSYFNFGYFQKPRIQGYNKIQQTLNTILHMKNIIYNFNEDYKSITSQMF